MGRIRGWCWPKRSGPDGAPADGLLLDLLPPQPQGVGLHQETVLLRPPPRPPQRAQHSSRFFGEGLPAVSLVLTLILYVYMHKLHLVTKALPRKLGSRPGRRDLYTCLCAGEAAGPRVSAASVTCCLRPERRARTACAAFGRGTAECGVSVGRGPTAGASARGEARVGTGFPGKPANKGALCPAAGRSRPRDPGGRRVPAWPPNGGQVAPAGLRGAGGL